MAIRTHYILVLLLIWILTTAGAYYIGTLNPDSQLVKNIKDQTELKIQKDYSQHKLFEPEFAYNDNESFMLAVNKCIDFVNLTTPPSKRIHRDIIVAMAVIESAYGTSRFAVKGNNLFGIRTWDKSVAQMKPRENPNAIWGVKTYITKCKSVQDMISILNRLDVYKDFRLERQRQKDAEILDIPKQIELLSAWSTNPKYTEIVKSKAKESYQIFSAN
tara:strand:+ start:603 stop:1253 length:651 start_codon:yes stop_codon:yes gene_type:complete